jgi:transcriptional regulator with XRE-family HTH domain
MNDKPALGAMLRTLRKQHGLTLKQMSERTDIPFSTLAKVEQDRLTLNYDKLRQICDKLNIRMSELFAEGTADDRPIANSRRSIATIDNAVAVSTPNYDHYYLAPELRQKDMIATITRLKTRSLEEYGEMSRHSGEEFILVMEGAIKVFTEFYGDATLSKGEGMYLDGAMGHAYVIADGWDNATIMSCVSNRAPARSGEIPDMVHHAGLQEESGVDAEPEDVAPSAKTRRRPTRN